VRRKQLQASDYNPNYVGTLGKSKVKTKKEIILWRITIFEEECQPTLYPMLGRTEGPEQKREVLVPANKAILAPTSSIAHN
jgi:hypothetical protein